jgi:hypothetical protein
MLVVGKVISHCQCFLHENLNSLIHSLIASASTFKEEDKKVVEREETQGDQGKESLGPRGGESGRYYTNHIHIPPGLMEVTTEVITAINTPLWLVTTLP